MGVYFLLNRDGFLHRMPTEAFILSINNIYKFTLQLSESDAYVFMDNLVQPVLFFFYYTKSNVNRTELVEGSNESCSHVN